MDQLPDETNLKFWENFSEHWMDNKKRCMQWSMTCTVKVLLCSSPVPCST